MLINQTTPTNTQELELHSLLNRREMIRQQTLMLRLMMPRLMMPRLPTKARRNKTNMPLVMQLMQLQLLEEISSQRRLKFFQLHMPKHTRHSITNKHSKLKMPILDPKKCMFFRPCTQLLTPPTLIRRMDSGDKELTLSNKFQESHSKLPIQLILEIK